MKFYLCYQKRNILLQSFKTEILDIIIRKTKFVKRLKVTKKLIHLFLPAIKIRLKI